MEQEMRQKKGDSLFLDVQIIEFEKTTKIHTLLVLNDFHFIVI